MKTIRGYTLILLLSGVLYGCGTKTNEYEMLTSNMSPVTQLAIADAKRDAQNGYGTYGVVFGTFFNVVGIAATALSEPTVPIERIAGRSPEYITAYSHAYKQEMYDVELKHSVAGCVFNSILVFIGGLCLYSILG